MKGEWEGEREKSYLLYIFFNVTHRAKQLRKGHKLSNLSVYRWKQHLQRVCDVTNDREEIEIFARNNCPPPQNFFLFSESGFTSGEISLFWGIIKTSGNNWINIKRDKSIAYRRPDLSKCGSHGEEVRNVLWGTAGERRRSTRWTTTRRRRETRICIVLGCGGNAQGESSCWSRAGPGWTVREWTRGR